MTVTIAEFCAEARQLAADDVLNDPSDETLILAVLDFFPDVPTPGPYVIARIVAAYDDEVANPRTPMFLDVRG